MVWFGGRIYHESLPAAYVPWSFAPEIFLQLSGCWRRKNINHEIQTFPLLKQSFCLSNFSVLQLGHIHVSLPFDKWKSSGERSKLLAGLGGMNRRNCEIMYLPVISDIAKRPGLFCDFPIQPWCFSILKLLSPDVEWASSYYLQQVVIKSWCSFSTTFHFWITRR